MERSNLESGPNEQEVIEAFDNFGFEDERTKELFGKFLDQCEEEADRRAAEAPGDSLMSNRANIESTFKVARLLAKTKNCKGQALEYLDDVLTAALQHESTQDLATEIILLIEDLGKAEE